MALPKIKGLVGQGMNARRDLSDASFYLGSTPVNAIVSSSGTVTAARRCTAIIMLWGAGAGGDFDGGYSGGLGGGSGACLLKRYRMSRGQTLPWVCGAPGSGSSSAGASTAGGDSTVILPNGQILRAGGGQPGSLLLSPNAIGGVGGFATGGDYNRNGGKGGNYDGPAVYTGEIPTWATGTVTTGSLHAGTGAAAPGFPDFGADFVGGNGNGGTPGGGGNQGVSGGPGRVVIVLVAAK